MCGVKLWKRDASSIIGFTKKRAEGCVETDETEDFSSERETVVVTSRGKFRYAKVVLVGVIFNSHSSYPAGVQTTFMQGIHRSEGLSCR